MPFFAQRKKLEPQEVEKSTSRIYTASTRSPQSKQKQTLPTVTLILHADGPQIESS